MTKGNLKFYDDILCGFYSTKLTDWDKALNDVLDADGGKSRASQEVYRGERVSRNRLGYLTAYILRHTASSLRRAYRSRHEDGIRPFVEKDVAESKKY